MAAPTVSSRDRFDAAADLPLLADGGASQQGADLWCTYAAVRTLHWLGHGPADADACAAYLTGCQNRDGGFAWQRGLPSDVWATYYCSQTLLDLGRTVPRRDRLARWLAELETPEGGLAMGPGLPADLWATYYAVRIGAEVLGREVADRERLGSWLDAHRAPGGGVCWSPGHGEPDVRACYYATVARAAAGCPPRAGGEQRRMTEWIKRRQGPGGGFAFTSGTPEPCLWATFRATTALRAAGTAPADPAACVDWTLRRRAPGTGFVRWETHERPDVWACFSAAGTLRALDRPMTGIDRAETVAFLRSLQLPGTGFTYREPGLASDALATASACLLLTLTGTPPAGRRAPAAWLRAALMPYEDGVMYMPGRGAEVRSTLWALSALAAAGEPLPDAARIRGWLGQIQNADGGCGLWEGRGSDLVGTVSALECELHAGRGLDRRSARDFLLACRRPDGFALAPRGPEVSLGTTCLGLRGGHLMGDVSPVPEAASLLRHHEAGGRGYAARPGGVPDLMSTYQAVLTLDVLGLPWSPGPVLDLLDTTRRRAGGHAWSPLAARSSGLLAACLGTILQQAAEARLAGGRLPIPHLNL